MAASLRLCVLAGLVLVTSAHAAAPHVHGAAALHVAIEDNRLVLELTSPLDNLVGFERAPRSDREKAAVRAMAARLREPEKLFVPTPEAKCTRTSVTLESPVLDPALLAAAPAAPSGAAKSGGEKRHKDGHASIDTAVTFTCAQPQSLSGLDVKAFEAFPNLKRLDVKIAGAKKQSAAKLTPRNTRVTW